MIEIVLRPKKDLILDMLRTYDGEIFIYPSHVEKTFLSGVGVINGNQLKNALIMLNQDMLKFYDVTTKKSVFLLLGSSFYKKELIENFGLKPFIIKNGLIIYYCNNPGNLKLKNWGIEKNEKEYEEPFDENFGRLNPLLHLATILPEGAWRRYYTKETFIIALKQGFLSEWQTLSELSGGEKHAQIDKGRVRYKSILECLKEHFGVTESLLQKYLNRAINDIARFNVELIRDLCSIAKTSNEESSLWIFSNFCNVITEPTSKERIKHREFPVKLLINDIEIHFKIFIPQNSTAEHVLKILRYTFADVKLLYTPTSDSYKAWGPSTYHFFSVTLKLCREDYDMIPAIVTDLINSRLNEITKEIGEASHMIWHISKRLIWVKKIGIEIEAPRHFEDAVFKAVGRAGWFLSSSKEELKNDKWRLKAQIWCDYPLYELKSEEKQLSIDFDLKKDDFEKLDEGIYDLYFPAKFGMDCSYFFTVLYDEIARKYGYTSMESIQ